MNIKHLISSLALEAEAHSGPDLFQGQNSSFPMLIFPHGKFSLTVKTHFPLIKKYLIDLLKHLPTTPFGSSIFPVTLSQF